MKLPKKYYTTTGTNFIYKKNVKEVSTDFETIEVSEEEFTSMMICNDFADSENFLENNPSFDAFGTPEIEEVEIKEETQIDEMQIFREQMAEMQSRLENLQAENEKLKQSKFSVSEMKEIIKKKTLTLEMLDKYKNVQENLNNVEISPSIDLFETSDSSILFSFYSGGEHKKFKTSNITVIKEFIPLISAKISMKITELENQVATL